MRTASICRRSVSGLATGTMLILGVAGCGGGDGGPDHSTVTLPEPVAVAAGKGGAAGPGTAAPAADTSKTPAAPANEPAPVTAEGWGTLKGRVTFTGEPPKPKTLVAKGDTNVKDGAFCATNGISSQRLVIDPETKGVQYALVYLPRAKPINPEAVSAAKASPVEFDQRGCTFVPHVMALMKGSKVNIKSADPVGHNVNFKLTNFKDNLSILPGAPALAKDVKVAENRPGYIVCDIHPWMKAWWMVTDNPYFAVTDAKGSYEIKNVPAGTQKVVVWQESVDPGFVTASSGEPVNIKADAETTKDFTIDASKVKPE